MDNSSTFAETILHAASSTTFVLLDVMIEKKLIAPHEGVNVLQHYAKKLLEAAETNGVLKEVRETVFGVEIKIQQILNVTLTTDAP
ncbi:hypothetical protein WH297_19270 [Ochrobactrum vermis]|uniref:Uncharacterized protein n=1 Tax=Ochrobactrum vermis TaxID=1827297 RepID=A0ABU8PIK7_9HYPH|nr:hypothetical protein [Ochrobactrum vermis]PQZ26169.1 hypothetical protein CQZ93_19570 [Ochrobactrum vermis]